MRARLLFFVLLLVGARLATAQFGNFGDVPVEIDAEGETRFVGGVAIAENNVVIHYGETTIYSDYAQYNPDTRDVLVRGNVRVYREGRLLIGERAVYNLETKVFRAADFLGDFYPLRFSGDTVSSANTREFEIGDGTFTTSDSSKPDSFFKAKGMRIYLKDRIVFRNVTFYVGRTPILWFPYLYQSLRKDTSFTITPGYTSIWGAFLLTQYTFPIADKVSGQLHLDLRSDRGVAVGFDSEFKYGKDDRSWGHFRSYYLSDTNPEINKTGLAREPINSDRYRISLEHRLYVTDSIYANIDVTKLSDARFLQDFEQQDYRIDPQPDSVVSLTQWSENYTLTAIWRKELNDFFNATERLPEVVLDVKRHELFESGIFHEGETGAARLRRNFAKESNTPDYDVTRVDTFHQFLYPRTFFGWLAVVPRAGFRGTYYSQTGRTEAEDVAATTIDNVLPTGAPQIKPAVIPQLVTGNAVFRGVFNAGAEASFKLSRAYEDVESRLWGLDGLRHIIQPYTDFSFVSSSRDPREILQMDRLNPTDQLPIFNFPQFTSIDSINDWTIWRFGVRNRLQTKRDDRTFNWLELDTFFDFNLQEPQFPGLDFKEGRFSNVYNRLRINPVPWVAFTLDSQLPLLDKGFVEVNTALNFLVNENVQLNVGHRYLSGNPFFQDSSLLDFGGYYRINDNWGISLHERYELQDHVLESQRYELHRDLSSWVASLGVIVRDNRGVTDFAVLLTFTLKDLPAVSVPLSFNPQSE